MLITAKTLWEAITIIKDIGGTVITSEHKYGVWLMTIKQTEDQ